MPEQIEAALEQFTNIAAGSRAPGAQLKTA
jgi:hypothetical protein